MWNKNEIDFIWFVLFQIHLKNLKISTVSPIIGRASIAHGNHNIILSIQHTIWCSNCLEDQEQYITVRLRQWQRIHARGIYIPIQYTGNRIHFIFSYWKYLMLLGASTLHIVSSIILMVNFILIIHISFSFHMKIFCNK